MENKYFQPEYETMPAEDIKKLQDEKLVKQVKYVYDNVKYYRDLMDKKGVKPGGYKGYGGSSQAARSLKKMICARHIHTDFLQRI